MNKNIRDVLISGFQFAELADVVFSGVFLKSQINSLNLSESIHEHVGDNEYIFAKKKKFLLKENYVIFCKTEYVKELFQILNKQCQFKNLKLITHQSDLKITRKLYNKKPLCISEWYSINVDTKQEGLFPIPIGIANFHSKNLNVDIFDKNLNRQNYIQNKKINLYLNFNPNTNFSHRKNLFEYFKKFNWVKLDENPISHSAYKKNLSSSKFTLAPWGNGIDTHRFWEALYAGSVPITITHPIYESFTTIPKVLVNNYEEVTKEFLETTYHKIENELNVYTLDELYINFWREKILSKSVASHNTESIEIINDVNFIKSKLPDLLHIIKSRFKIINRLRRYIYKKIKL